MVPDRSILHWSIPQLQKHIRHESQDTGKIIFTNHALTQMKKRHITQGLVLETLRHGKIILSPEVDYGGDLKCRMEYLVAGLNIRVVIALCDDNPNLVVVTAI